MSHRSLVYSSVASFLLLFMYSLWFFFFFPLKECKIRCQQALSYAIWVWAELEFTPDEPEVRDGS